jgi:hypothetical protein
LLACRGTILGTLVALIGMEGLKKSKAFSTVSGAVTKAVDQVTEADIQALVASKAEGLAPYLKFVLKSEPVLRRLAGERYQFRWLHASLEWIKKATEKD